MFPLFLAALSPHMSAYCVPAGGVIRLRWQRFATFPTLETFDGGYQFSYMINVKCWLNIFFDGNGDKSIIQTTATARPPSLFPALPSLFPALPPSLSMLQFRAMYHRGDNSIFLDRRPPPPAMSCSISHKQFYAYFSTSFQSLIKHCKSIKIIEK